MRGKRARLTIGESLSADRHSTIRGKDFECKEELCGAIFGPEAVILQSSHGQERERKEG